MQSIEKKKSVAKLVADHKAQVINEAEFYKAMKRLGFSEAEADLQVIK